MSFSSSSLSLDSRETFPFFFRTIPSDRYLLAAMLAVILEWEWSRVALLTQDVLRFRAVSTGGYQGVRMGCVVRDFPRFISSWGHCYDDGDRAGQKLNKDSSAHFFTSQDSLERFDAK